jgi:hypothetical protein
MKIRWSVVVALLVAIALAFLVAYGPGADATSKLTLGIGYALLVIIFLFGVTIVIDMLIGKIDLSQLLEEVGEGGASMSRFQLLVFTFVIAFSLFMMVASSPKAFPVIPKEVLMLLGISASTYAVSKGIQMGNQNPPSDGGAPDQTKKQDGGQGGNG